MEAIIVAAISSATLIAPLGSLAQDNPRPTTRAQVKSELAAVEKAGYAPRDWVHYPENIQAAQRRVDAEREKARCPVETPRAKSAAERTMCLVVDFIFTPPMFGLHLSLE